MAAAWKWEFYDPIDDETYIFDINPNSGAAPEYHKNVIKKTTIAPDGQVLLMEGRDQPLMMNFSGTILRQTHYEAMITWFQKRRVIQLTDDFERVFEIYITDFAPSRKRSINYPWRHEYSAQATIVRVVS